MSVLYFLLPLAGVFVVASLLAFRWACRDGQFDDLDTPAVRILFDDGTDGETRPVDTSSFASAHRDLPPLA